ncbi:unnamed protein product, partial [Rotaria sordida]
MICAIEIKISILSNRRNIIIHIASSPQSYYFDPQTPYIHHRFQPKQLYDPNKPKVSSTSECHNSSKVIRKIEPKNKKKTKQTTNNDNSTVS